MRNLEIKKILVIKLRNIGDVLLTSPVFSNLRTEFPGARICALVNSGTEGMITENPDIDEVFVYNRSIKQRSWPGRMAGELELLFRLRRERFDCVINLTEGDRGAVAAIFSGARTRIGMGANDHGIPFKDRMFTQVIAPPVSSLHTVEQNLFFLESVGIPTPLKKVSFHYNEFDGASVREMLRQRGVGEKNYIHAHMTSRWMFKTLPPHKAASFLDTLADRTGLPLVMTAAPVEKELTYLRLLVENYRTAIIDIGGALTLKQMGALSANARFFTGVDSAPMHIAAAVGTPVLALFGPSAAQNWGPWDNGMSGNPYRQRNGVQRSLSHMVLQADCPCVPCHADGCNGSKVSDCLAFEPRTMAESVESFLDSIGFSRK